MANSWKKSDLFQQNVDGKECEVVVRNEDNFTTTGPMKRPFLTSSPCEATDRKRTRSFWSGPDL